MRPPKQSSPSDPTGIHGPRRSRRPARMSVEVTPVLKQLTLLDTSAAMLREGRHRLDEQGTLARVSLVQADGFRLPLRGQQELVYTLRLIRHFRRPDRIRLYREIAMILQPGGWLVFDAVNERVSAPFRARAARGEYEHYDALLRPPAHPRRAGRMWFDVVSLMASRRRYWALQNVRSTSPRGPPPRPRR